MKKIIIFTVIVCIAFSAYAQEINLIPAVRPIIGEFLFKNDIDQNMILKVGVSTTNWDRDDLKEDDNTSLFVIDWFKHEFENIPLTLEGCVGITASLIGTDTSIDDNFDLGGYVGLKYNNFTFKAGGTYLKQSDLSSSGLFALLGYKSYFIKGESNTEGNAHISILGVNDFLEDIFHLLFFADYSAESNAVSAGLYDLRINLFRQMVFLEAPAYYNEGFNFRPGVLFGTPEAISVGLYFFVNNTYMGGSCELYFNARAMSELFETKPMVDKLDMTMRASLSYNDAFNNESFNTKIYDRFIMSISMSLSF